MNTNIENLIKLFYARMTQVLNHLSFFTVNYKHERWKEQPDPGSGKERESLSNKDNFASEFISNISSKHRQKRSISYERYVEVMVVADKTMADYHGKNLNHYILALMSIVSTSYFLR